MTYHYTDSGLDDVFLENGFREHVTSYGIGVSIEDGAGLHEAIGRWLIDRQVPLDGAALRFLRLEMELTQRDLAGIIGATEQSLRLWEKHRGKGIPGSPDRLVRALFAEFLGDTRGISHMLKRLTDVDVNARDGTCFRHSEKARSKNAHSKNSWSFHVVQRAEDAERV